jgi:hypothetical protein
LTLSFGTRVWVSSTQSAPCMALGAALKECSPQAEAPSKESEKPPSVLISICIGACINESLAATAGSCVSPAKVTSMNDGER